MSLLENYQNDYSYEIGMDEAGRGPLFGRLYVAAVIWPKGTNFRHDWMKDSKKFHSKKKIKEISDYIKENAIYKSLLNVRNDCFLMIKIMNKILKQENYKYIDKLQRNFKQLTSPMYNIYQIIDIDNYY